MVHGLGVFLKKIGVKYSDTGLSGVIFQWGSGGQLLETSDPLGIFSMEKTTGCHGDRLTALFQDLRSFQELTLGLMCLTVNIFLTILMCLSGLAVLYLT